MSLECVCAPNEPSHSACRSLPSRAYKRLFGEKNGATKMSSSKMYGHAYSQFIRFDGSQMFRAESENG